MGPRSRFHSRSLMTLVAGQVQELGWNGCTGLDSQCHTELDFWNDNLRSLNGARIRVEGTVKELVTKDLVSDAGDMLVGVTEFNGGVEDVSKRMQQPLLVDDLGESSTFHELRACEMALGNKRSVVSWTGGALGYRLTVSCYYSESWQHET